MLFYFVFILAKVVLLVGKTWVIGGKDLTHVKYGENMAELAGLDAYVSQFSFERVLVSRNRIENQLLINVCNTVTSCVHEEEHTVACISVLRDLHFQALDGFVDVRTLHVSYFTDVSAAKH